jgi:hypothetical protein
VSRVLVLARATLLAAPVVTGLIVFPRQGAVALATAVALAFAGLRRLAVVVLCALLAAAMVGARPDAFPRPTPHARHHPVEPPAHEHHHRSGPHRS